MKDYMEKVAALVRTTCRPIRRRFRRRRPPATSRRSRPAATSNITVKNYIKPGDLLAIGFDMAREADRPYKVNSYVEKPKEDDVTLAVTFGQLQDGTGVSAGTC